MIMYEKLEKALSLLEEQHTRLRSLGDTQPKWIIEAVQESTIQRFEVCWDVLWKTLKRYLREEIGLPEIPNGPNPVLRLAHENNLLSSSIEIWLNYAKIRVSTSHDYSEDKAHEAFQSMESFITDAINLYTTMSNKEWQCKI